MTLMDIYAIILETPMIMELTMNILRTIHRGIVRTIRTRITTIPRTRMVIYRGNIGIVGIVK